MKENSPNNDLNKDTHKEMQKKMGEKKQQPNEDSIREAAADKAKPRCSTCGKYTDKKTSPQCYGHGGGGSEGPGAGGDSAGSEYKKDLKIDVAAQKSDLAALKISKSASSDKPVGKIMQQTLTPKEMMLAIITDLLTKKLLTIEDNKGLCTLTIKCDPKLLSEEQRNAVKEFVKEIKKELEDFKHKNGMPDKDCFVKEERDKDGNVLSLTINIPNPKLYAEFINHLESKNLLPIQNVAQDRNEITNAAPKQSSPFNAIKEGPKPKGWKE